MIDIYKKYGWRVSYKYNQYIELIKQARKDCKRLKYEGDILRYRINKRYRQIDKFREKYKLA